VTRAPRVRSLAILLNLHDARSTAHPDCHMMNHEELGMMQVVEVYAS
jgi:hypothetical protein